MDQRDRETLGMSDYSGQVIDFIFRNIDAQGSTIYGQMNSTQNAGAQPSQAYSNINWAQSLPAGSSQTSFDLRSSQNMPGNINSVHLSPNPNGFSASMSRTVSQASQQTRSSQYSSTGDTSPMLFPQSFGGQSSVSGQTYRNSPGELAQPVMSPTWPSMGWARLDELLSMINQAGQSLYGVSSPNHQMLRSVQSMCREAANTIDELIGPIPRQDRSAVDENKQFRCRLCPSAKRQTFKNKGTFTRHINSKHYPHTWYHCPFAEDPTCSEGRFTRKDKHHGHMRTKHNRLPLNPAEMEAVTEVVELPQNCVICGKRVTSKTEFLECLCKHCLISGNQDDGFDGSDSDGGDDGDDGHNGGRNQHNPSSSHGDYGNANSFGYGSFSGNQFDGSNSWGGGSSYTTFGGTQGMYGCIERSKSRKTSPESVASVHDKATLEAKPNLADLEYSQQRFHSRSTPGNGVAQMIQAFQADLSLRLKHYPESYKSDMTSQASDEKQIPDKERASFLVDVEIARDFQRLRYFEYRIFENQVQDSYLAYAHETLVDSQLAIISSTQDILYRKFDMGSQKAPEIPADHIFYLAKERDHTSSEANLAATKRVPKTRAHLRVRIRAIAGILALRAAVGKTDIADNIREVGDGWELGIPISSRATQEEAMKLLIWLVQVVVFFLKMPPRPKVFVMLEESSLDVTSVFV